MKNILVTGASRGLGLAITRDLLADETICVYAVSRTVSEALDELQQAFPQRLIFKSFDLAQTDSIKSELFDRLLTLQTPLHGFVNNAAMAYDDLISNLNHDRLLEMFQVNVFSPMMITKLVLRNMLLHRVPGSIVHISSISVHTGYKGLAMYASTKGALEAFSKNTAREWGELGIRSNCVVAGFMETEMSATLTVDQQARIHQRTSLKRPTDPGSVASLTSFLLSDQANSITGQALFADAGTI